MDAKLKAKWVKALRSGRYKQAKGTLKRVEAHCCLGVLYRIQRGDWAALDKLQTVQLPAGFDGGLTHEQRTYLARLNDGVGVQRCAFPEIADYIEANL